MQPPSPSLQQGYDDGRWRSSIENKLDKALDLLGNLNTNYQLHEQRITTLENRPKEQAAEQQQSQSKVLLWFGAGGCLYMIVSVILVILSTIVFSHITLH